VNIGTHRRKIVESVKTHYADANGLQIAYQVHGNGPKALIIVPGVISHIELLLEVPEYCDWIRRLTAHFKVIVFDKRGQGLSDRTAGIPGPEQRMDDITAIAAAEQLNSFSLFGLSEGAAIGILYAASFPDRVEAVTVFGGFARFSNCDDYSLMFSVDALLKSVDYWGTGASGYSFAKDKMPEMREAMARFERACATPNAYRAMIETNIKVDIRDLLPEIKKPVLVMHRRDDAAIPVGNGRFLADHLPNAHYIEFAKGGHLPWNGDMEPVIQAVMQFATRDNSETSTNNNRASLLSTVMFTDIVESSAQLAHLGDSRWREILDAHDRIAKREIEHHQGHLVKTTGDGLLVTFSGPVRAIKCAQILAQELTSLNIHIRCGLHIGEVEPRDADITGLAVYVAARVMELATSDQILITKSLADLIAGSDLSVTDHGKHQLKGLSDNRHIFEVA
jgi:class 3 adenylate cyclase/pimeloyl-ACP methyl ester carboxylesterase